jgi:hypothetical protein
MKPLKTILLWLLLLAIPIQGLAVNAMTICKASHQRVSQDLSHSHSAHHESMAAHGDEGHHHFSQHGDVADIAEHGGDSDESGQKLSACSACAACSMGGLWMFGEHTVPHALTTTSLPISYFAFHVPPVEPERPEHPPRVFLA